MSADITADPAIGATSFAFPAMSRPSRRSRIPKSSGCAASASSHLPARRSPVRNRQGWSRHVRGAVRYRIDHPARRPRSCHPVIDQGPGQFLAEIGQLSGRLALVDGHAEGDVETLLIAPDKLRALLVAEAELGERIMRALILRRVNLIQGGTGGPVLIGLPSARRHGAAAEFPGAQRPAPPSARSRHRQGRRRPRRALLPRAPICRWSLSRRQGAAQSDQTAIAYADRHDRRPRP